MEGTHVYRTVKNLRQRICRASRDGALQKVRSLQRLRLRSRANIFARVRRGTQVNQGQATPGVDKRRVTSPEDRAALCPTLRQLDLHQVHPVRRVAIPTRQGKRPLGLPPSGDRCVQAMGKTALEPCWEARFAGVSDGFRPGRGGHDAIQTLCSWGRPKPQRPWGLEADSEGAVDPIGHAALVQARGNVPARGLLKQGLNAGDVEEAMRHPPETGVPQGGVRSPLGLHVALHGMEPALGRAYTPRGTLRGT